MNNGYSGTGISIIFYLLLALLMPIIQIVRLIFKHGVYKNRFVVRHFLYGIMIIITVVIGISWLTTVTGIKERAHWHVMLNVSAATTVGLLLAWILLPLLVKAIFWVFHLKHSATQTPLSTQSASSREHNEYRVIDSMMSRKQWLDFRSVHYGMKKPTKSPTNIQINFLQ